MTRSDTKVFFSIVGIVISRLLIQSASKSRHSFVKGEIVPFAHSSET